MVHGYRLALPCPEISPLRGTSKSVTNYVEFDNYGFHIHNFTSSHSHYVTLNLNNRGGIETQNAP